MKPFIIHSLDYILGEGKERAIANAVCVSCNKSAGEFRSELDQQEYNISGLCQHCQDEIFHSENA